jgi:hypothetical protein
MPSFRAGKPPKPYRVRERKTAGSKVQVVVGKVGGRGKSYDKTITAKDEHKLLRAGLQFVPRQNNPSGNAARGNDPYDDIIGNGPGLNQGGYNEDVVGEQYGQGDEASPLADDIIPRRRPNASLNQSRAANWLRCESRITHVLYSGHAYVCQCTASIWKEVRFISLTSYETRRMSYCPCGASAANIATTGFFPSTPVEPGTVFAIDLLKLLHYQAVRGAVSKYAWAEGLRAYFEDVNRVAVQPFFRLVSTS